VRLSEKTLELNICAQTYGALLGRWSVFWFGLTQKQEARAGFDACTRLNGRLLILQFKASRHILKSGDRRFHVPHSQVQSLVRLNGARHRSVFFAFPLVGTTPEIAKNPDLLSRTWLVDAKDVVTLPPPTKAGKTLRRSGHHYVDVRAGRAVFHSDPFPTPTLDMRTFFTEGMRGADGIAHAPAVFGDFWELARHTDRGTAGLVLYARKSQTVLR
jgi:hypothetical protein